MQNDYKTQITIESKVRLQIANELNQVLSNLIALSLQVENTKWNILGINNYSNKKMLAYLYKELQLHKECIAERIVQLKNTAKGSIEDVIKNNQLEFFPLPVVDEATIKSELFEVAINNATQKIKQLIDKKEDDLDEIPKIKEPDSKEEEPIECKYLRAIAASIGVTLNGVRKFGTALKESSIEPVTEVKIWSLAAFLEKELMFVEGCLLNKLEL